MSKRPQAKVVKEVCTLCGLDWQLHGNDPTSDKCVELLLSEIRSLNAQLAHRPLVQPIPLVTPRPAFPRQYPYWGATGGASYGAGAAGNTNSSVLVPISHTPSLSSL